jgi:valyl-tRNA synthetase
MREPVADGKIEIIPDYFNKTYFHWIENLRDWCISRQIWYGHRIPVWYKGEEIFCGIEAPIGEG